MQSYQAIFTGKNVIFLPETQSTNADALNLIAKTNPPEGTCVMTDFQTDGRGQIGSVWHSQPGKNLLVSYIFYPKNLLAIDQFYINMVVSLALVGTLADFDIAAKVKWPNDIYVGSKKLTGILIQSTLVGSNIKATVIGIGLNINQTAFLPEMNNSSSMAEISGKQFDRSVVFDTLSNHLEYYYQLLIAKKFTQLKKLYLTYLYLMDKNAQYKDINGHHFNGKIIGVDNQGKLVIKDNEGFIRTFAFKEVKYVL